MKKTWTDILSECEALIEDRMQALATDERAKLKWLLDHLEVYLTRLNGFCEQLGQSVNEFRHSDMFAVIIVSVNKLDLILCHNRVMHEWDDFKQVFEQILEGNHSKSLTELSCQLSLIKKHAFRNLA